MLTDFYCCFTRQWCKVPNRLFIISRVLEDDKKNVLVCCCWIFYSRLLVTICASPPDLFSFVLVFTFPLLWPTPVFVLLYTLQLTRTLFARLSPESKPDVARSFFLYSKTHSAFTTTAIWLRHRKLKMKKMKWQILRVFVTSPETLFDMLSHAKSDCHKSGCWRGQEKYDQNSFVFILTSNSLLPNCNNNIQEDVDFWDQIWTKTETWHQKLLFFFKVLDQLWRKKFNRETKKNEEIWLDFIPLHLIFYV